MARSQNWLLERILPKIRLENVWPFQVLRKIRLEKVWPFQVLRKIRLEKVLRKKIAESIIRMTSVISTVSSYSK